MGMSIKRCKDCEHFHIKWEPKHYKGLFTDFGQAACDKYDLVVDFRTNKRFDTLYCIKSEAEEGVTFDERIEQLKKLSSFLNGSYGASINFAIETMRKYQKIEKIIKTARIFTFDVKEIRRIAEVVEDGTHNNNVG